MNTLFAWAIGGTELIIILVAVLILFGSKKIPEFARGLGQGIKEFKKASREVTDEIQNAPAETPAQPLKSISSMTYAVVPATFRYTTFACGGPPPAGTAAGTRMLVSGSAGVTGSGLLGLRA